MTLMDVIRKWKESRASTSQKYKEMEENARLEKMLVERAKSGNQRELEKYYKDKQEAQYKSAVDKLHQQQTKESWKGKQIFQGHKNIMKSEKNIMQNDRKGILEKSMFLDRKKNAPMSSTKTSMYFD
jgi:hypothetical protein